MYLEMQNALKVLIINKVVPRTAPTVLLWVCFPTPWAGAGHVAPAAHVPPLCCAHLCSVCAVPTLALLSAELGTSAVPLCLPVLASSNPDPLSESICFVHVSTHQFLLPICHVHRAVDRRPSALQGPHSLAEKWAWGAASCSLPSRPAQPRLPRKGDPSTI